MSVGQKFKKGYKIMNVQELIDELNKIDDKTAQVVIFDDHKLNAISMVDPLYFDSGIARVDLNMGEDVA